MKLKERLAALRQEKGLSQVELAERLNVTRQAISKWETGTAVPSIDNLIGLSRLYGISLDDLLGNNTNGESDVPPMHTSPTEGPAVKRKGNARWLIIAVGAVLILGVLLAIMLHTARNETPDTDRVKISEMESELVGNVSLGGFTIEEW